MEEVEKESEWCSSDVNPEFFKVYLRDQSSSQLTIPRAFVKYFNGVYPKKSVLSTPNKRRWEVYTKKTNDKLFFDEGWEAFVKDNSLKQGEFLLFTYVGASKFDVSIYGTNGCGRANCLPYNKKIKLEREDEAYGLNPIIESHNTKVTSQANKTAFSASNDEVSLKVGELQQPRRKRGRPRGSTGKLGRKGSSLREVTTIKKASKYPRFEVVMIPRHINTGTMTAPLNIIKKHFKAGEYEVKLNISGTSWPVKLTLYKNVAARFSKGWLGFVKENHLQCNDVCVFELKMNAQTGPSFAVNIIRKPNRQDEDNGGSLKLGRKGSSIGEVTAIRKASEYPRFEAIMGVSNLNSGILYVPLNIINKYFKPGKHEVKLEALGILWPVKLTHYAERSARFSTGWDGFVKENNLGFGDVCVFELKNVGLDPIFGVKIIRKPT